MPAWIEHARSIRTHPLHACPHFFQFSERFLQIFFGAENSHQALHHFLQVAVDLVSEFALRAFEGRKHFAFRILQLRGIQCGRLHSLRVLRRSFSCALAEYQQVRKRVSTETVRTMQSRGGFACRKKPAHRGLAGLRIDANSAHHIVAGRPDFHRPSRNIHVSQFFELVVHAGQFLLHVLGGLVGSIQIRPTVFRAAAFLHFGVDGARHHVSRRELHALGIIFLHEALASIIFQCATFAAHCFGH